ncbi:hypothetical protein [Kribbella deserti]|uniref:YtxH domain-containing protein n=1 Tax=Kribbella deserti TaxID=1926257 RepID=A0ABV6QDV6_9ACTN
MEQQDGEGSGSSERRRRIVHQAADLVGATAGAVIGGLTGDPVGAGLGAAGGSLATSAVTATFDELMQRKLSRREQARLSTATKAIVAVIEANLRSGRRVREDWFATDQTPSAATEIAEGALYAVSREHQERKVPLMGQLVGNLIFTPEVDTAYANYLVKQFDELTYRQLCLLALFNLDIKATGKYPLRQQPADGTAGHEPVIGVLQEVLDLYRRTMIQQVRPSGGNDILLTVHSINPDKIRVVSGPGGWLTALIGLPGAIPASDVSAVAHLLR